jgi:large subunit ribosomal protein L28
MARVCEICGKKPLFGHNISHAHNVSQKIWYPNLKSVRIMHQGSVKKVKICTRCLRSGKVVKAIS